MRRATACLLSLTLLAGCPQGSSDTDDPSSADDTSSPSPTADETAAAGEGDASTGDGSGGGEGDTTGEDGDTAGEDGEDDAARLTCDVRPEETIEQDGVSLTLHRIAILRRTAENLEGEPIEIAGEEPGPGHYLALTVSVKLDGLPYTRVPEDASVEEFGPFVVGYDEKSYLFESVLFEPLPEPPGAVYQYRQVEPPPITATKMDLVFSLRLHGAEEDVTFEFTDIPAHGVAEPAEGDG